MGFAKRVQISNIEACFLQGRQCEYYCWADCMEGAMINSLKRDGSESIDRAIRFAQAALHECDDHGLVMPAIDIASALERLAVLRETSLNI
jgi:hypothetical protein